MAIRIPASPKISILFSPLSSIKDAEYAFLEISYNATVFPFQKGE